MPPKKAQAPSKKTEAKKKEKIIEDKTFGLKNKKGAKTQKFVQHVEHQVKFGALNARQMQLQEAEKNKKKTKAELEKQKIDEINAIFRPVATQKVEKGVDPKSVLCAFFKQGTCTKGERCKFSHDVGIERKTEKKSLYDDVRQGEGDNMADWDENKLADVIEKKHGATNSAANQTDIICKFFIDAVESSKYGWFWECPNGGAACKYRHCLPPGFVLKKDQKKEEKKDQISIEELVEKERAKLGYDLPKITLVSFKAWKLRKIAEKKAAAEKESEKRRNEFKSGRSIGLSGRDMFTFNPELANDGGFEEGESIAEYLREDDDDDDEDVEEGDGPGAAAVGRGRKPIRELDLDELTRYNEMENTVEAPVGKRQHHPDTDRTEASPSGTEPTASSSNAAAAAATTNGVDIDEDLFDEDDDDLSGLEDELEDLKV